MSLVITSNQVLDANDFNDGKSFVKSGIIATNQDPEEQRMSAYQNGVNTAHQESEGEQKISSCKCNYCTNSFLESSIRVYFNIIAVLHCSIDEMYC